MALERPEVFRQSLLQGFTTCPRRTKHSLMVDPDLPIGWVEETGDLGTTFHEFMHRYLKAISEQGYPQMPTQEAIEVMYEVLGESEVPLPWDALDALRGMALGFCNIKWPVPLRIAALEETLTTEIVCSDGELRTLKGQPDIVIFDPPDGLLIIDGKSGKGKPKGPRTEPGQWEVLEERKYLTDTFQGDVYSLLCLLRYPAARRVIFRELHIRSGQIRQATMGREALEHVERKLAVLMMDLDRAISEGEDSKLWRPRPGKHCNRQCPVTRSCPIPSEQRGVGALESQEDADAEAEAYVVQKARYTQAADRLKAWEEAGNPPGRPNEREEVRWEPPVGPGRRFGLNERRAA